MATGPRLPGFVHLLSFRLATKGVLSDEALRALESELVADPELGDRIPGAGGVRKMRFALGARGKSGGMRVVYYYRNSIGRIYLITAYPKNVKDNLTQAEKNELVKLTAMLDQED